MGKDRRTLQKRIDAMLALVVEQEKTRYLNTVNQVIIYELPPDSDGNANCYASYDERDTYNLERGLDIQARIAEINRAGKAAFLLPEVDDMNALTQEESMSV